MAKFDPFRQGPENAPAAPFPMPPGQVPPPGYGQPAYGQPAYPQPQPGYGQPYPMPQQPAYPTMPAPAYPQPAAQGFYPPQAPAPVPYGGQQFAPQNYPPNPYAPPPPTPAYPTAYAPQPVPMPAPVPMPQPMPMPSSGFDLPMSARAMPVQPAPVTVRPVTVKPVMPNPAPMAPAALATQPRPVQPAAVPAPAPANLAPLKTGAQPAAKGGARPLPAPAKDKNAKPKVDAAADPDAPPPDPTDKVIKGAPPWMISMVVHMVLLIVLALITIASISKNQIFIVSETVYAEKLGEQIIDDQLQSAEALNVEVEPVLSIDPKPADDPLAAPPIVELSNVADANVSLSEIAAPSIGMALNGRTEGGKKALLGAYGGNATTEAAVREGLLWLKKNQLKDGSWSLTGPFSGSSGVDNKVSATAMALLAFQGAGHTHKTGEFKDVVVNGWKALKAMQNPDGFFICDAAHHHRLYAQAQATIAACELYGMTKDEAYRPTAQKALDFAIAAQDPYLGGWRYEPKQDSDLSVTGWFVMALQSGMMAGLEVASPNVEQVNKFLDQVQANGGSHYMYKPGMEQTLTMTAEGLLCRQYLGWKHDDERMVRGLDYVCANSINYNDANVYYWYYATQAAHHMGGHHWKQWNQVMIQTVPQAQVKTGGEKGSWSPDGDRWGTHGGRLFVTCLHIYMLEAYYRHLPLYKHRIELPKGVMEGAGKALDAASK